MNVTLRGAARAWKCAQRAPEDMTQSSLEHVRKLAEVLTAIGNYLDAAIRLEATDTRSARMRLREALQKSHAQLLQADETLRRLRDLLRDKGAAADK